MTEASAQREIESGLSIVRGLARLHDWVLVAGRDGRVVWVSDALAAVVGRARTLKGERWLVDWVEGTDTDRIENALAVAGRVSNQPIRILGEAGPIEATFSATRVGADDGCAMTVVIARPERPEDREFQEEFGYTRAILDNAPEGVVVIDRSGFITYANPAMARMTGYAVRELRDQPLAIFLPSHPDYTRVAEALSTHPDATHDVELAVSRRDDSPLRVAVSARVLALRDGTQVGWVAYVRDITRVEAVQRELERKNEELEHTVHAVSHDLRSPLAAMLGFSRLLREDYGDVIDEKGRHFIHRIEEAGRTMEGLIHNLLELSRIGNTQPLRLPVDPVEVLEQLRAELKPRLDATGIQLTLPTAPPMLPCDRTQLYQVLSNLIGNAIDHMQPQGAPPAIDVSIRELDDGYHVSVRDNGAGIDPAHHDQIFGLFRSLDKRKPGAGTGIGLAVVRKVAEAHGGRAWVESTPGAGSAFHVTFSRI